MHTGRHDRKGKQANKESSSPTATSLSPNGHIPSRINRRIVSGTSWKSPGAAPTTHQAEALSGFDGPGPRELRAPNALDTRDRLRPGSPRGAGEPTGTRAHSLRLGGAEGKIRSPPARDPNRATGRKGCWGFGCLLSGVGPLRGGSRRGGTSVSRGARQCPSARRCSGRDRRTREAQRPRTREHRLVPAAGTHNRKSCFRFVWFALCPRSQSDVP